MFCFFRRLSDINRCVGNLPNYFTADFANMIFVFVENTFKNSIVDPGGSIVLRKEKNQQEDHF